MSDHENIDVLVIGAHPDDVEVGVGGIVATLVQQKRRVAILDLTEGELASRGSVEERREEGQNAARALGCTQRVNCRLPDGGIANNDEQRKKVIAALRDLRPRILLAPMHTDRHPDHDAAHFLIRDANYLSGLARVHTGHPAHRADRVFYYRVYGETTPPSLIVDISAGYEAKLAALREYKSQLFNPQYDGAATYVSSEAFWNSIMAKAAYWGSRIGVPYGEPLYTDGPVGLSTVPGL